MNINNYLYEMIEDYQLADTEEERNEIFKAFCSSIWSSENKRRVYTKKIKFSVRKDLRSTDIGQIFDVWSELEYTGYKAMTKETDWCSLIRQKINNLYTLHFDNEVILKQDYIYLLSTPKRLYYQWLAGTEMDADTLTTVIDDAIDKAQNLKATYQKQKMQLPWHNYKEIIESFLKKILHNCRLIEDFENKSQCQTIYDFINEDNFYISYICKSLQGEMLKWQKQYYGVRDHQKYKRCKTCGALIENTGNCKMYCADCAAAAKKRSWMKATTKYRNKVS